MQESLKISIVIPTLDRPETLKACLASIYKGTYQPHEIILITEEGELAKLRNKGLYQATGEIVVFTDDDVEVTEGWLESIAQAFKRPDVVGVSGPAIIRPAYRLQRDIFRFRWAKAIYDYLFLGRQAHLPGLITRAGTWTTGASEEACSYEGEVDYLEACNMAVRREAFLKIGGFDEQFRGIGDWSEPDAAYRLKSWGKLWFSKDAKLYHNPSKSGAFLKRKQTGARLENYFLFAARWVKPHPRHTLFKWFLISYYRLKEMGIIR